MRKAFFLLVFFYTVVSIGFSQDIDEKAIRKILAEQTKEWNKGNIPAFMDGYWKSDSLIFIGKTGVTYGWQETMDNYIKNYPDTAAMGKLQFYLVEVKRLSEGCFFVVGKWYLSRSIGDISGTFTLLLRKVNNQWVIVADHSS